LSAFTQGKLYTKIYKIKNNFCFINFPSKHVKILFERFLFLQIFLIVQL